MAIIEVNFISKCLMRVVTFNAIIPVDKFGPQAENAEQKPLKTLCTAFSAIIRTG